MKQFGYVLKTNNGIAEVEVKRISGCGGGCSNCSASCDAPKVVVKLENRIGANPGDYVEIEAKSKNILKYALIVYMIPFIMLILGVSTGVRIFQAIGVVYYEILGFVFGIIFLIISFVIVRIIDKLIRNKNSDAMKMIRVLE